MKKLFGRLLCWRNYHDYESKLLKEFFCFGMPTEHYELTCKRCGHKIEGYTSKLGFIVKVGL